MAHKPTLKNHSEFYDVTGKITDDVLQDWYEKCQPEGSGPLGIMRMLCATIEQVAKERGFELTQPKGLK